MNKKTHASLLALALLLSQHINCAEHKKFTPKLSNSYLTWKNGKYVLGAATALGAVGALAYYNQDAIKNWWTPQDLIDAEINPNDLPAIAALEDSIEKENIAITQELKDLAEKQKIVADQKIFLDQIAKKQLDTTSAEEENMNNPEQELFIPDTMPVNTIDKSTQNSTPETTLSDEIKVDNVMTTLPINQTVINENAPQKSWWEFGTTLANNAGKEIQSIATTLANDTGREIQNLGNAIYYSPEAIASGVIQARDTITHELTKPTIYPTQLNQEELDREHFKNN